MDGNGAKNFALGYAVGYNDGAGGTALGEKNITQNGVYTATSDNLDGYSKVTVNVEGEEWKYPSEWLQLPDIASNQIALIVTNMTTNSDVGERYSMKINLQTSNTPIIISVDWGDGTVTSYNSDEGGSLDWATYHVYTAGTGHRVGNYEQWGIVVTVTQNAFFYSAGASISSNYMIYNVIKIGSDVFNASNTNIRGNASLYYAEVPELGEYLFYGCRSLNRVKISGDITEIPTRCFSQCYSLDVSNLNFENVTSIGDTAFDDAHNIKKIYAPNCVTVESNGFSYCYSLSDVTLKSGAEYSGAFSGCYNLYEIKEE